MADGKSKEKAAKPVKKAEAKEVKSTEKKVKTADKVTEKAKPAAPKKAATSTEISDQSTFKFKKKASIHPNYRIITVVMTNGETFQTRSTYNHDTLKLDVDPLTHPAWTKELNYVAKTSEVSSFMKKFAGLSILETK